jgi:hypothetical protein
MMDIARGDSFLDAEFEAWMESPLPSVSGEAWTKFIRSMIVQPLDAVSPSNALGLFAMTPRRLADFGIVIRLQRSKKGKRTIWAARFPVPGADQKFLTSAGTQYRAFFSSMADYAEKIKSTEILMDPNMSLSGALAILHRAGAHGLFSWRKFPDTVALYERVAGIF